MIYSFQDNFILAHITRTGGVSLANTLEFAGVSVKLLGQQHSPLYEAKTILGDDFDPMFKAAIVRNPWDRLMSWQSFIASTVLGDVADPEAISDPDAAHWRDFDAFVDDMLNETAIIDGETRPVFSQVHQLSDANETLLTDYIGRFETYETSVQTIFEKIGKRMPRIRHENKSPHHPYTVYYSDAAREMVAEKLALDIATFGYSFEAS